MIATVTGYGADVALSPDGSSVDEAFPRAGVMVDRYSPSLPRPRSQGDFSSAARRSAARTMVGTSR